jgi:hypothetical protein
MVMVIWLGLMRLEICRPSSSTKQAQKANFNLDMVQAGMVLFSRDPSID